MATNEELKAVVEGQTVPSMFVRTVQAHPDQVGAAVAERGRVVG
jgi:hypothetical protein